MKDYATFAHVLLIETNNNRHEILSSQDAIHWKTILDSKYDFLMKNNMWWLEDLPKDWLGEQGINSEIWKKYNLDGSVVKFKLYRKISSSSFLPNIWKVLIIMKPFQWLWKLYLCECYYQLLLNLSFKSIKLMLKLHIYMVWAQTIPFELHYWK